jgi:hypothetical protein
MSQSRIGITEDYVNAHDCSGASCGAVLRYDLAAGIPVLENKGRPTR